MLLALVAGCGGGASGDGGSSGAAPTSAEVQEVLARLGDSAIAPAYGRLGTSLDDLAASVDALCTTPSDAALDAARSAWREAIGSWQATRAGGVGPAMEARLMSDVAFAARAPSVEDLVAGDDPVTLDAVAERGAAVRGLYALEVALFGEGSEALATAEGARRCTYASSLATLAAQAAAPVVAAWVGGDAVGELAAGLDGGPTSSVSQLVNEVSFRLTELDQRTLHDLAAADSYEDLPADRAEGPAAHGIADRRALLAGVVAVLGDADRGLVALVAETDPDLADRLVAAAERATATVGELDDSMALAFDDREAVAEASDAVAELQVLVATELAAELGVTISFSDADGDS